MHPSFEHTVTQPVTQETDNPKANKEYDNAPDIFGAVGDYPGVEIFVKIFYFVTVRFFHINYESKNKNLLFTVDGNK